MAKLPADPTTRHVLSVMRLVLRDSAADREGAANIPDAAALIVVLEHHGLLGIYLDALKKRALLARLPDPLAKELEKRQAILWNTGLQLAGLQDRVCGILSAAAIAHLVLKGLSLSERLYGSALVRPGSDVDIAVAPAAFSEAHATLLQHGFRDTGEQHPFHRRLQHTDYRGVLELHDNLATPHFHFSMDAVMGRARPQRLSDRPMLVMHPADEIRHLLVHNLMNGFVGRFSTLMDLAVFLRQQKMPLSELPLLPGQLLSDWLGMENPCTTAGFRLRSLARYFLQRDPLQQALLWTKNQQRLIRAWASGPVACWKGSAAAEKCQSV